MLTLRGWLQGLRELTKPAAKDAQPRPTRKASVPNTESPRRRIIDRRGSSGRAALL
jgi:hypothetical protein